MKKKIALLLAAAIAVLLCSCGGTVSGLISAAKDELDSITASDNAEVEAGSVPEAASAEEDVPEESSEEPQPAVVECSFTPLRQRICAGSTSDAALLDNGTVSCSLDRSPNKYIEVNGEWLDWSDVVDISLNEEILAAVKSDGTVVWCGGRVKDYNWVDFDLIAATAAEWKDVVQISAGPFDVAVLKSDGSVEIVGYYSTNNLDEKDGFTQVSVYNVLLCLREDGTVYCFGTSYQGSTLSYDTRDWENIVQVYAGFDHAVGLRADGTVAATGKNTYGQCDVQDWTDIVQVCAGRYHTIGLKADGTVVYCGEPPAGCEPDFLAGWTDIVEVNGFFDEIMGLKSDGTIVYAGWEGCHNPVDAANIKG